MLKITQEKNIDVGLLLFFFQVHSSAMQWAIKYTAASSKETVKEAATNSVLRIKYSSIMWRRNIPLKAPFSLSDGDYPMVFKCFGTNNFKVYRQVHDPKSWKQ